MLTRDRLLPLIALTVLSHCSLESKKNTNELQIDLSQVISSAQPKESPFEFLQNTVGTRSIPLPGTANFSCFGVNVIGPGIPDSSLYSGGGPPANTPQIHQQVLNRQSYCAYRGIISPALYGTGQQQVTLQIPAGPQRVVQVIGSYSATQCATQFNDNGNNSKLDIYEIGRAVVDTFSDVSIDIQNEWPTAVTTAAQMDRLSRVVDCDSCEYFTGGQGLTNLTASWASGTYLGVAQKIQITTTSRPERVQFYAKYSGSPTSVTVKVFSDAEILSNLSPSSAGSLNLVMSAAQALTTTFDDYVLQFPSGGSYLSPGNYWLVFEFTGAGLVFFGGDGAVTGDVQAYMGGSWISQSLLQNAFFKVFSCN